MVYVGDFEYVLLIVCNVFVCWFVVVSLWVVCEVDILIVMFEEIVFMLEVLQMLGVGGIYYVGVKKLYKCFMIFVDFVGMVEVSGFGDVLWQVCKVYVDVLVWLVFFDVVKVVIDVDFGMVESWFVFVKDKIYKQQQFYGIIGMYVGEFKCVGWMLGCIDVYLYVVDQFVVQYYDEGL